MGTRVVYIVEFTANIVEEEVQRVKIPFLFGHVSKQSLIRNKEVHCLKSQVEKRLKLYQFPLEKVPNQLDRFEFSTLPKIFEVILSQSKKPSASPQTQLWYIYTPLTFEHRLSIFVVLSILHIHDLDSMLYAKLNLPGEIQ